LASFCLVLMAETKKRVSGMKVAVPRYGGRIAPRFGFVEDVLIAEVDEDGVRSVEVLPAARRTPWEIPGVLHRKGVRVVLTGGIHGQFQALFHSFGIEVIWGLIGTPEEALDAYLSGRLVAETERCLGRRRHRHGKGPRWE